MDSLTQRASSETVWPGYVVLIVTPWTITALSLGLPNAVVVITTAAVAMSASVRGLLMYVKVDGDTLHVRNFWKTHEIRVGDIIKIERREFWLSPVAIFPNLDVPVIVRRSGRAVPVIVGMGGRTERSTT